MRHCMEWMVPGEPCILWTGAMPMAAMYAGLTGVSRDCSSIRGMNFLNNEDTG